MDELRESKSSSYLIKRVQHTLRLALDQSLAKMDVTLPQFAALSALAREPGSSNAELARAAFVTPQTMHKIVQVLEKQSLVEKKRHPHLGRVQQLFLTEEGEQVHLLGRAEVDAVEEKMFSHLEKTDIAELRRLLWRCVDGLTENGM